MKPSDILRSAIQNDARNLREGNAPATLKSYSPTLVSHFLQARDMGERELEAIALEHLREFLEQTL